MGHDESIESNNFVHILFIENHNIISQHHIYRFLMMSQITYATIPRFRVFRVDCGELFWSQEFASCVRYPATGCQMMTPSPTSPATSRVTYTKINHKTTPGKNLNTTIVYGETYVKKTFTDIHIMTP